MTALKRTPYSRTAKTSRSWLRHPLAIGEPVVVSVVDDVAKPDPVNADATKQQREPAPSNLGSRIARLWRQGSDCLAMGLFCSVLTCLASVTVNSLCDGSTTAWSLAAYLRRLVFGYSAAATVVVTVFPLLASLKDSRR